MRAYEVNDFRPPAPVAVVSVHSASAGITIPNIPMLMDTGADVSLLPREAIAHLLETIDEDHKYELEGFDGTRSLEIQLLGKTFRGQFLVVDGKYGILARNVLNSLVILFDGPSLFWKENR